MHCDFTAKLVPVGYGIKKLQIMITIVDDLVSVDSLIEDYLTAEPINEYVQSVDIVAFNKICKYLLLQRCASLFSVNVLGLAHKLSCLDVSKRYLSKIICWVRLMDSGTAIACV